MNRLATAACLVLAMVLVTTQSAFAARIYNFLPNKVWVTGLLGGIAIHQIELAPGQRSDSIGWSSANVARVDLVTNISFRTTDKALCSNNFGIHAEIQGGNYMTIGHIGNEIVCTVCGSEHNAMNVSRERTTMGWQGSSRTGC